MGDDYITYISLVCGLKILIMKAIVITKQIAPCCSLNAYSVLDSVLRIHTQSVKYVTLAPQCWFVILFFLPSSSRWTWDLVFAWQMRYCKPYKISILVRFLLLWCIPWPKAICRRKGLFQLRWVLHYAVGTGAQGRNLKARTDSETIEEFCLLSYFPWHIHFVFLYHLEPSTHS